jgi:hypothetical protein
VTLKRKNSKNENRNNGNNIDIDELEAETARIHKEMISERTATIDSERGAHKEKRTVSDNTRPVFEQTKPVIL